MELLVRASVWLAMAGWLAGVLEAVRPDAFDERRRRRVRLSWTLGFVAYGVHVLSAFHVFYEWSHGVAWRETARQTAEATGVATGVGLWLNHLVTVVWGSDVAWWWLDARSHRRRGKAWTVGFHGFLYFMVFNGSVVFGNGPVRWLGAAICLLPAVALATRVRNRP